MPTYMKNNAFYNGFLVGIMLQLAVGPVFFFVNKVAIINGIGDGVLCAIGVTLADLAYISLALFGVSRIIEQKSIRKRLGFMGSLLLIAFGIWQLQSAGELSRVNENGIFGNSFLQGFMITIINPLTIVFWTGVFSAKSKELSIQKEKLWKFGVGAGLSTFAFLSLSSIASNSIGRTMDQSIIIYLNIFISVLIILYGGYGIVKLYSGKYQHNV